MDWSALGYCTPSWDPMEIPTDLMASEMESEVARQSPLLLFQKQTADMLLDSLKSSWNPFAGRIEVSIQTNHGQESCCGPSSPPCRVTVTVPSSTPTRRVPKGLIL